MAIPGVTSEQERLLGRFAAEVRRSPHNLVSRRARDELESRHVPEAVALAGLLPRGADRVLDVGSGGGFPGIVIAVMRPELDVHLLEATAKKTDFLRQVARDLELEVTVHHGRAEDLRQGPLAAWFDVVTARAVAPLRELLDITVPFLAPEGALYAVKGERWAQELAEAQPRLERAGAVVLATPEDQATDPDAEDRGNDGPRVVVIGRVR